MGLGGILVGVRSPSRKGRRTGEMSRLMLGFGPRLGVFEPLLFHIIVLRGFVFIMFS